MCLFMKHLIRDAFQELHHVVWPTGAETKKYFAIVTSVIAVCALVFFLFGSAITSALFAVRGVVAPERPYVAPQNDQNASELLKKLQKSNTGSTSTGAKTSTGTSK